MSGILPQPPELPGIKRWQLISTRPTVPIWSRVSPTSNLQFDWHPNGRSIALGDESNLLVMKAPSFELMQLFCGHTAAVTKVEWSPNGQLIASASRDGTVRIWDVETGTPGEVLIGHKSEVHAVGWHPDGERLASADSKGDLRVWRSDGRTLASWHGHSVGVVDLDWSPDGGLLASIDAGGTMVVWNDRGTQQSVIEPNNHQSRTVAWRPDGAQLLTGNQLTGEICTWDLDGTPGRVFTGHKRTVRCAAWSPDGKRIASVAEWDRKLRIWDVDGEGVTVVDHGQDFIEWVEWSPDGRSIATGSSAALNIWDASGRLVAAQSLSGTIRFARLSPDGQRLAVNLGTGEEFHMLLCNADGSDAQFLDDLAGYPLDFDWTPDGQSILVGGGKPSLRLCGRDGSAGLVFDEDPNWDRGPQRLSVSPNGKQAAVNTDFTRRRLCDSDLESGRHTRADLCRSGRSHQSPGLESPGRPHCRVLRGRPAPCLDV